MRVLMCVPAYAPARDYGGPVTKIGLLAPALQQRGVEVEVLTANFGVGRTTIPTGRRVIDGLPVTYLPRLVARGWLSISRGAGRVVRAGGFDVVHCFGLRDGLVIASSVAAARSRLPIALEPMGMAVPRVRSERVKASFDRMSRLVTSRADVTIATSELEATELEALGYRNVVMRPNPIDLGAPRPRPPARYDLCYVGRLHTKKRLDDIVAALALHPSWTAVVAGPDEDGTAVALAKSARSQGVSDRITIRGWVDADERRDLVASSRCFVLPSMTENFGNAAAEAIALGTPAVVTDQCGVASLVRDTGMGRVVPVETGAIIAAIEAVMNGTTKAVGNALASYAPDVIAEAQIAIYESITPRTMSTT